MVWTWPQLYRPLTQAVLTILTSHSKIQILENIPLAPFTTLKIGGPARFFVQAGTEEQVVEAFEHAAAKSLDLFVLGGGSNILVSDSGFYGLVLQVALKGVAVEEQPPRPRNAATPPLKERELIKITAQAGEDWDNFVEFCVSNDLVGVECLSGIPGFIGGTPVQNVGAYGQEVSETIVSVRCFDRQSKTIVDLANSDCGFSYRKSIFNSTHRESYIVLAVTYELKKGGEPKIAYKDIREYFAGRTPTLRETRDAVVQIRRAKSMVIDEHDPNSRSAGSFFKNPIVPFEKLGEISTNQDIEKVPHFPVGDSSVKIPAAWLIERSGFQKGFRLGNAAISTNHSLALVNLGSASAAEIIALKDMIQSAVEEKFGISLQPEPIFVGF
jgi:UDP-N-acetylmuramate dehydrogenase